MRKVRFFTDNHMALLDHYDRAPRPANGAGLDGVSNLADIIPISPSSIQKGFLERAEEAGVVWVRETQFGEEDGPQDRIRRTGFIAINGYLHLLRVSEAHDDYVKPDEPVATSVMLHGLSEFADTGTAKNLHDEFALANTGKRTVSIATNGVSVHGKPLGVTEALSKTLVEMAHERIEIVSQLFGEDPVDLVGTSMGTIISTHSANHNLQLQEDKRINLTGLTFISPGVVACDVDKHERFRLMPESELTRAFILARFFLHMAVDSEREAFSNPRGMLAAVKGIAKSAVAVAQEPAKGLAVLGNLNAVRPGTPWEVLKRVAENYPIHVITGTKDPLREEAQWQALQKLHPENVKITLVPNKGHCLSANPKGTAAVAAA
jgi:pimeloyl-ACP methyl ester carboxylesterase